MNETELDDDEPGYCSACCGTGEGYYDGSACRACHGRGEAPTAQQIERHKEEQEA